MLFKCLVEIPCKTGYHALGGGNSLTTLFLLEKSICLVFGFLFFFRLGGRIKDPSV